jgi:hypothetical protein
MIRFGIGVSVRDAAEWSSDDVTRINRPQVARPPLSLIIWYKVVRGIRLRRIRGADVAEASRLHSAERE